jgi:predicted DNA-binding protein
MSEKKGFVRKNSIPTIEDLEKTVDNLNNQTTQQKKEKTSIYSYSIKLDEMLEKRVEGATKKLRQTKKGFFLSAIENYLESLGY